MSEDIANIEGPWLVAAGTDGNERFGALLKNLRERSGVASPKELAQKVGVHESFVRGIERGAQAPSAETARALLDRMVKDQDRIEWVEDSEAQPFDLVIRDPKNGRRVAFEFKAAKRGQNRRTTVEDQLIEATRTMMRFGETWTAVMSNPANAQLAKGLLLEDIVKRNLGHPLTDTEPLSSQRVLRVARMLASADERTIELVEQILLTARSDADAPATGNQPESPSK